MKQNKQELRKQRVQLLCKRAEAKVKQEDYYQRGKLAMSEHYRLEVCRFAKAVRQCDIKLEGL